MNILNKGSRHCFSSNYDSNTSSYDDWFANYIYFHLFLDNAQFLMCVEFISPSFESSGILRITIINNAFLQELVMQGMRER